jgi:hypothetical protein
MAPKLAPHLLFAKCQAGVGVEKIFPLYSPNIDKIEILRRAKVRRAKLYHIREKAAKEISRQMRRVIKTCAKPDCRCRATCRSCRLIAQEAKKVPFR